MGPASLWRTAPASTTFAISDDAAPGVCLLSSGARDCAWLRRRPRAGRPRHHGHLARLGHRFSARRLIARADARPGFLLLCRRPVGVRRHRPPSRGERSQRHGVGRSGRLSPHPRDHSSAARLAARGIRAVSRVRHPEATPDPPLRAPLRRRLRCHVRRSGRGGLYPAHSGRGAAFSRVMENLAKTVGESLKARAQQLVTAESCTGGWVAQVVTAVAGSSAWFERGFVTYSNSAKQELLGVRTETFARHGAVSEETAREMALGALARSKADVAVAVTGVAGPSGGSPEKPVGTVCFAWADRRGACSEKRHFSGDRESVRRQSVVHALEGVLRTLDAA